MFILGLLFKALLLSLRVSAPCDYLCCQIPHAHRTLRPLDLNSSGCSINTACQIAQVMLKDSLKKHCGPHPCISTSVVKYQPCDLVHPLSVLIKSTHSPEPTLELTVLSSPSYPPTITLYPLPLCPRIVLRPHRPQTIKSYSTML